MICLLCLLTGKTDNADRIRGNLRKQINAIIDTIGSTEGGLKIFESLDIDDVEIEGLLTDIQWSEPGGLILCDT